MMMTVKQVSVLTGVSVRTLQFYDEIGLLKPTQMTESGYRLYDESALEVLQQILFFKELDFTLKEIKVIMENPQFDKKAAFEKQKELIRLKRDRLNGLLELLDKLIHGETCMDFKKFDMSEYFQALGEFKATHTAEIIRRLGSMEQFDELFGDLQSQEVEIAEAAVRQYGSIPLFSKQLLNMETLRDWEQKFDAMEKFVSDNKIGYLEDKLYFDPDIPPSRADLILSAVRDGRDWGDSFEGSLSLYSAVSRHIHSSKDEAAEKYLDKIYGSTQIQTHKEAKR